MIFENDWLDYDTLTGLVQGWARDYPEVVQLQSLATTPEGRHLWLLRIGPPEVRPSVWVDGNMHASEVTGSSAALGIAWAAIQVHAGLDHGLPDAIASVVREVPFHVLPRISPDGAEAVLKTGKYVRSVPRDTRPQHPGARWVSEDLDGDGLALVMRVLDPAGDYVEHPDVAGLLVPRQVEDSGPFYRLYPEGHIENFDGQHIPRANFLGDNYPDLNRNFPFDWRPAPEQVGAGAYPGSEPEAAAVVAYAAAHPELMVWCNLHTFGGVFIRPLGDKPDSKLHPDDLAIYRQLEQWGEQDLGYPMVSGFEEFTYEPDTPIRGDLSEWAFHHRGCIAWVTELWDLFEQAELPRPKRFVDRYTRLDREDLAKLAAWDAANNQGRCVRPWRAFHHPQLGDVEIGGLDPRFGFWNPPKEMLAGVVQGQTAMLLKIAAMLPRLRVELSVEDGVVHCDVRNIGYLSTQVLQQHAKLDFNEPVAVTVEGDVVGAKRVEIGHLDGWGHGRWSGAGALYFQRSKAPGFRRVSWPLRGSGTITVTAGSCRLGTVTASTTT